MTQRISIPFWPAGRLLLLTVLLCVGSAGLVIGQKMIGDLSVQYELSAASQQQVDSTMIQSASKTLLVRGGMSKSTIVFNDFSQSTIHNESGDKAYVLYHVNNQDYMSVLSAAQWEDQYSKYKDMQVTFDQNDTKTILGYHCIKAVAKLKDGSSVNMYYTPELKTTVGDNPYEYQLIPGLILEYEAQVMKRYKITLIATKLDFGPVPAAKFIIPKEGYRLLDPNQLRNSGGDN